MQRELEADRKAKAEQQKDTSQEVHQPKILDDLHNRNLAAQGVYFRLVFFSSFFSQLSLTSIEAELLSLGKITFSQT